MGTLINVGVGAALLDHEDRALVYAEVRSDLALCPRVGTDGSDLVRRKLSPRMTARRKAKLVTVLRSHVGHVVGVRSEEQVLRVDAFAVVAAMANKGIANRANPALIREAMGPHDLSVADDGTVALVGDVAAPLPATIRRRLVGDGIKVGPELIAGPLPVSRHAPPRAPFRRGLSRMLGVKRRAALLAKQGHRKVVATAAD